MSLSQSHQIDSGTVTSPSYRKGQITATTLTGDNSLASALMLKRMLSCHRQLLWRRFYSFFSHDVWRICDSTTLSLSTLGIKN